MRMRACSAAVLLACLGLSAPPLHAQAAAAAALPAGQEVIVTIKDNGISRGEFTLLYTPDGDFWIAARDLARLRLRADAAGRTGTAGDYHSLRALSGGALAFDEPTLTVTISLTPAELEPTRLDLARRVAPPPLTRPPTSTILNYRATVRHTDIGPLQLRLTTDLNVRVGEVLVRQEAKVETGRGVPAFARGSTQLIWDDRINGRRVIAGDQLTVGGPFGTVFPVMGLALTKLYAITPDVLYQPTASARVTATTPSQVEVAVDGVPVYRANVPPGPVALQNLHYYSGVRNVRVTVTDAAGQRQIYDQPFLFTDTVLAEGMHEYSYFVGRRSELAFDDRFRYREPAWQGFHRYGLNNHATLEAGGEGNRDFANAGAGLALRSDRLGLLSVGALGSVDHSADRSAQGWSTRYTYIAPRATFYASRRRLESGFRTFGTVAGSTALLAETRLGGSAQLTDAMNVSVDFTRTSEAGGPRRNQAVRLSSRLGRQSTLHAEYLRSVGKADSFWNFNVYLRLELERNQWVSGHARASESFRAFEAEAGKQLPEGEGFGYRISTQVANSAGRTTNQASGYATWNLQPASIDVAASTLLGGGKSHYVEAGVSGAVVALDGFVGTTRHVPDGFALARLGVPQAGVDVFLNSQAQGKTDDQGNLLIPNVGAFGRQDVSLDDKQLSMQYNVARKRVTIAPPYRSGTLVTFGGRKLRAVTGFAWLEDASGTRKPIASRSWSLARSDGLLAIETAPSGDFYLEDGPPGRYTGVLRLDGKVYSCGLVIPDFEEPVHELRDGLVCR